jgi:ATP-dependent Lhr-like helicase
VELFCTYCAGWHTSYKVKNVPEDLKCANCGAGALALIKGNGRELRSLYKRRGKKDITKKEERRIRAMQLSANLYLSHGRNAVVAQAARGIGPQVAKRVLPASGEDELYKKILKKERDYARTKRFWD